MLEIEKTDCGFIIRHPRNRQQILVTETSDGIQVVNQGSSRFNEHTAMYHHKDSKDKVLFTAAQGLAEWASWELII